MNVMMQLIFWGGCRASERAEKRWTDEEERSERDGMVMWSKSEMEGGAAWRGL